MLARCALVVALVSVLVVTQPTVVQSTATTSAAAPRVLWKSSFGFAIDAPPLLFKDELFVASGESFGVLDASNGTIRRNTSQYNAGEAGRLVMVGDSRVAFNTRASIACRNTTSLEMLWDFVDPASWSFNAPPLYVPSESAVFAVADGVPALFKIDAVSGKKVWKVLLKGNASLGCCDDLPQPVFAKSKNLLIVPAPKAVQAVHPGTGAVVWSHRTKDMVFAFPVLSKDEKAVYVATKSGEIFSLSTTTGEVNHHLRASTEIYNTPSLVDDVLYFSGADPVCFALDVKDFSQKWSVACPSAPVGLSRVFKDTVIFGAVGFPFALHLKDGSVAWNATGVTSDFYYGVSEPTPDGTLYLGDADLGEVYALQLPS